MDRLRIEKGRVRVLVGEAAVALLEVEGLEATVEPDVAVVIARAHLLQGDDAATAGSLVPALAKAAPTTTQIEGWLVEAARRLQSGSATRARSALANALRLATRPRARRPFRDAHIGVRQLLAGDRRLQAENTWLTRGSCSVVPAPMIGTSSPVLRRDEEDDAALPMVVEKLTHKELEVLGLLAELLTTEEIASSMFVSVNTIRTHVRSILRKLGVSRRNAAVRRARELELLPA